MDGSVYNAAVAEHFRRPPAAAGVAISGSAGSSSQGAVVRFGADLEGECLCNVGFRAWACPHIIAACSLITERLEGSEADQLAGLNLAEMLQELEIPVEKTGKILILKDALRACHDGFKSRQVAGTAD